MAFGAELPLAAFLVVLAWRAFPATAAAGQAIDAGEAGATDEGPAREPRRHLLRAGRRRARQRRRRARREARRPRVRGRPAGLPGPDARRSRPVRVLQADHHPSAGSVSVHIPAHRAGRPARRGPAAPAAGLRAGRARGDTGGRRRGRGDLPAGRAGPRPAAGHRQAADPGGDGLHRLLRPPPVDSRGRRPPPGHVPGGGRPGPGARRAPGAGRRADGRPAVRARRTRTPGRGRGGGSGCRRTSRWRCCSAARGASARSRRPRWTCGRAGR